MLSVLTTNKKRQRKPLQVMDMTIVSQVYTLCLNSNYTLYIFALLFVYHLYLSKAVKNKLHQNRQGNKFQPAATGKILLSKVVVTEYWSPLTSQDPCSQHYYSSKEIDLIPSGAILNQRDSGLRPVFSFITMFSSYYPEHSSVLKWLNLKEILTSLTVEGNQLTSKVTEIQATSLGLPILKENVIWRILLPSAGPPSFTLIILS